jgi:hypothetical protein
MSETLSDVYDEWVTRAFDLDVGRLKAGRGEEPSGGGGGAGEEPSGGGGGAGEEPSGGKKKSFFQSIKEKFVKPKAPMKPVEAGKVQTDRADKLLKAMPEEDQKKVQKLLDDAPAQEKGYLLKAVASKHSAQEIEDFQKKIAGKDEEWLQKNLHVVGQSKGKGIKQQWSDSCGPTTMQAMKAELDPVYALKLRGENKDFEDANDKDGTKVNPKMAEEQKDILTRLGKGTAVARGKDGGVGMALGAGLNSDEYKTATGLKFDTEAVKPEEFDERLKEMDDSIKSGLPVPLRVSDAAGSGGHFVLLVGEEGDGDKKTYSIHDPWDGKIVKVTGAQLKSGDFKIAGWNKLTHIYKPSAE